LGGETEARAGEIDTNLQARVVTTIQEIASSQSTTRTMKAAYQQIHSSQITDHQPQSSIYLISTRQHFSKHPTTKKTTKIQKKKNSLINHKPSTTKDRTQHDQRYITPILRCAITKPRPIYGMRFPAHPSHGRYNKTCSLH
jgi:hypothetical protein